MPPIVTRTLSATLRPLSESFRHKVRACFSRSAPGRFVAEDRRALAEAVFHVMDDLEHRSPKHPQVDILRAVRNVLLDDLGENENPPGSRYPAVEAIADIIRQRTRRGGNPAALLAWRARQDESA